jgi:hypothetical protein
MMNQSVINGTTLDFMREPYASMSADELLRYFQTRNGVRYFPLSHGSPAHVERAEKIVKHEFDFNNEVHQLPESFDWKVNPSLDIEWLILLHKFYYAKDLAAAYDYTGDEKYTRKWMEMVSSWIRNVPDGFINSQVTGRRLQQWLSAYHYFVPGKRSVAITPSFLVELFRSIHSQTLYLCEHLTPEGNHRTIELYSIFLVAVVFHELRESAWLLDFAKQELLKNMEQDLLDDGVHRELSTDYHHTVLKNHLRVRTLAVLNGIALSPKFDEMMNKALEFSMYVHKPDGLIPAINDGDSNSYLSLLKKACSHYPNEQFLYVVSKGKKGTPPCERSKGFSDSGYYVLRGSWTHQPYEDGLYLLFDCGPLGFGSHGHYDLLSFEAAAYGHSLIVDPGRYTYSDESAEGIKWRQMFKSTAYHNTVVVDGKDQIPYRRMKPVGPEPRASVKTFATADGFDFVQAQALSHEYPVVHERTVFFAVPEYWVVTDMLHGEGSHTYDLYFHLAPRALGQTTLRSGATSTWVDSPNLLLVQPRSPRVQAALDIGFVSPQYGVKQEAPIVKFSQKTDETAFFHTVLYPYRAEAPTLDVERLVVSDSNGGCSPTRATVLKITIGLETEQYSDYLFLAHERPVGEYAFDDIVCRSRMLFLRKDRSGRIVNLQAEGLEYLEIGSTVLIADTGVSRRVSYESGRVHLCTPDRTLSMDLDHIDGLSELARMNHI